MLVTLQSLSKPIKVRYSLSVLKQLRLVDNSPDSQEQSLRKGELFRIDLGIQCLAPFGEGLELEVVVVNEYDDVEVVKIRLPVFLTCFCKPTQLTQQVFGRNWKALSKVYFHLC